MAKVALIPKFYTYKCDYCKTFCKKKKHQYYVAMKRNQTLFFCSQSCRHKYYNHININVICANCHKPVTRGFSQISKTKHSFCDKSCSATFNNKLKRNSRRSKIEIKFFNLLVKEFPQLDILPNDKTMLDGLEADIAIPSLKLVIEWNGIVHFKPIYGQTQLTKVQDRDAKKLKIASNKNINLIVISDLVSNDKILKQAFNDVSNIIKSLI